MFPASASDIKAATDGELICQHMCVDGLLLMMMVLLRCDRKAIGRNSQSSVIGSMFDIIQFYAGLHEKFGNSLETERGFRTRGVI